jgi:hypothetical protein
MLEKIRVFLNWCKEFCLNVVASLRYLKLKFAPWNTFMFDQFRNFDFFRFGNENPNIHRYDFLLLVKIFLLVKLDTFRFNDKGRKRRICEDQWKMKFENDPGVKNELTTRYGNLSIPLAHPKWVLHKWKTHSSRIPSLIISTQILTGSPATLKRFTVRFRKIYIVAVAPVLLLLIRRMLFHFHPQASKKIWPLTCSGHDNSRLKFDAGPR